jgi:undecaprenyl-phosphate 4-deoxy-4-formamido-L-arabinose transferase
MPVLSIVVPVYRSAQTLPELHRRLSAVLLAASLDFEIVFVEDCGQDSSWDVISTLAAADPRVSGLRLTRNFGQHNALLAGIRAARGHLIATLDDDLQHPPEELPKLLAELDRGFDVVYGWPDHPRHSFFRNLASLLIRIVLQKGMGAATARRVSAFRLFRANLKAAFAHFRGPSINLDLLLTWGASRFSYVNVRHDPRKIGSSGYSALKLIRHALVMITSFSTIPLRLASLAGFAFAAVGFLTMAYVVLRVLIQGVAVPGFAFLASSICLFSGVQLLALGIVGEYLASMFERTMDRPSYLIRDRTAPSGPQ